MPRHSFWIVTLLIAPMSVPLARALGRQSVSNPDSHRFAASPVAASPKVNWQPTSIPARDNLDAAEAIMHRDIPTPNEVDESSDDTPDTASAEFESLADIITPSAADVPSGRAEFDFGSYLMLTGDYDHAMSHLVTAASVHPNDSAVSNRLAQCRLGLQIESRVKSWLPRGQKIDKLVPVVASGRRYWAALSSVDYKDYVGVSAETFHKRPVITIFREIHSKLTLSSQFRLGPFEHIGEEYLDIGLWAFPMTRSNTPELVFSGMWNGGGSAEPSRMQVYHWNGKSFRLVLDQTTDEEPLWIQDVKHNGSYQVRSATCIGDLSHTEMVRWADVYAWNGRRFVKANARYSEGFRDTASLMRWFLSRNPNDFELLEYLGKDFLYEGRRHLARVTLRKAEKVCRGTLNGTTTPEFATHDEARASLEDINKMLEHLGIPRSAL